jgi:hypothetical protein
MRNAAQERPALKAHSQLLLLLHFCADERKLVIFCWVYLLRAGEWVVEKQADLRNHIWMDTKILEKHTHWDLNKLSHLLLY